MVDFRWPFQDNDNSKHHLPSITHEMYFPLYNQYWWYAVTRPFISILNIIAVNYVDQVYSLATKNINFTLTRSDKHYLQQTSKKETSNGPTKNLQSLCWTSPSLYTPTADKKQCTANLGIKLGTRSQDVTIRSKNQNTGQTMGSGTQDSGLKLISSIGKYLTKYRRVHPTYI